MAVPACSSLTCGRDLEHTFPKIEHNTAGYPSLCQAAGGGSESSSQWPMGHVDGLVPVCHRHPP